MTSNLAFYSSTGSEKEGARESLDQLCGCPGCLFPVPRKALGSLSLSQQPVRAWFLCRTVTRSSCPSPHSVQVELCFAYNQSAGNPSYRRNISECGRRARASTLTRHLLTALSTCSPGLHSGGRPGPPPAPAPLCPQPVGRLPWLLLHAGDALPDAGAVADGEGGVGAGRAPGALEEMTSVPCRPRARGQGTPRRRVGTP